MCVNLQHEINYALKALHKGAERVQIKKLNLNTRYTDINY